MINSPCEQQVEEPVDHPKIISSVSTYSTNKKNIKNYFVTKTKILISAVNGW